MLNEARVECGAACNGDAVEGAGTGGGYVIHRAYLSKND